MVEIQCEEDTFSSVGHANYPLTDAGTNGVGTCNIGYEGLATRACDEWGFWSHDAITSCTRTFSLFLVLKLTFILLGIMCPPATIGTASFEATYSMTMVYGTCASTYIGSPTATCLANGTWGPVVAPCVSACFSNRFSCSSRWCLETEIQCPATGSAVVGYASYPSTDAGTTGIGTCNIGYEGSATRACSVWGAWSDTATTSCTRMFYLLLYLDLLDSHL